MPGLNTTGAPNTLDYNLGRGVIYFASLGSNGLPGADGFRDLGNAPEFSITIDTEDLRHQSSRDCLKFTDKRFVISQEIGMSYQLEEWNFQNISDFFSGSTETYDNPHDTTFDDVEITSAVVLGNWYQLRDDNGARVYNLDAAGCVYSIEDDATGTGTALVEGTDFEINEQLGLVRFLPTGSLVAGDAPGFSITTAASTAQDLDQVNGLIRAEVTGALMFVADNAGDCGQKTEWLFHKVSLSADGDMSLISDEVGVLPFSGVAEVNSQVSDTSKVLTVRTYDMPSDGGGA